MPSVVNSITSNTVGNRLEPAQRVEPFEFAKSLSRVNLTVAPQRTRITPDEASSALSRAYQQVTGERPNEQTVALLTAQWAHETAHGASMYNYNFGGIKGTGPSGLSVEQKTKEGWGSTERKITDRFRAYDSIDDGAADYVKLLTQRYPEAITAAKNGDATGFVHGLKQRGYFTGDERAYAQSVSSISSGLLDGGYSQVTRDSTTAQVTAVQDRTANVGSALQQSGVRHLSVGPLTPDALLSGLSTQSEKTDAGAYDSVFDAIQAVSSLSMAEEVVRASLQIQPSRQRGSTG